MLNGRIYRAAALPLLVAIAVCALSLASRPAPLAPGLQPATFDGAWTVSELHALAAAFPDRVPGGAQDRQLAAVVARTIEALGGPRNGAFSVSIHRSSAPTVVGERTLLTVVARRAGATDASPIVVVAHRDAAHAEAPGELSATAVLLELARVLANQQTNRPLILVSTSGGSGGDGGAAELASLLARTGAPDAAIVLGDLASAGSQPVSVLPWSDSLGSAPAQLAGTAAAEITQQGGVRSGTPGLADQLVHLALPFAPGEEGVLNAAGVPSVLLQASGEAGPRAAAPLSAAKLEATGSAALATIDALDNGPAIPHAPQAALYIAHRMVPAWSVRLLVIALLLPALLACADAVARVRRRGEAVARWAGFTLACAMPFLAAALCLRALGATGIMGALPGLPTEPGTVAVSAPSLLAAAIAAGVLVLACGEWPALVRALRVAAPPRGTPAGVGLLVVLDCTALVLWLVNPFAALFAVPAVHLWMLIASPELRPRRRWAAFAVVLLGACPPVLLLALWAHELGTSIASMAWTVVLLVAGGQLGVGAVALWCAGLGCFVSATLAALAGAPVERAQRQPARVTIPGPITYAGPGSLGGTESALRR
jgi:hypothetical protein